MDILKKKVLRDIDDIKMWFYLIPHKKLAVDTETTGLDYHTLELVGISLYNGEYACYIDLYENPDFDIIIKFLIEQFKTVEKVIAHNVKFDYMVLYKYNLYLPEKRFCTQVAAHLLNENVRKSLKFLAQRFEFTEGNIEFEEAVADGYQSEKFYEYAMNDAIWCWKLHEIEQPKLIEEGLWKLFWEIEMPFTETLAHVEMNGILVDKKEIANLGENTCEKLIDMEKRLFDIAEVPEKERSGFNLNSGPTIIKLLTQKFGLTIKEKTKKGKLSVGKATLERLSKQHEFPKLLLEYRKARKLQTAFVNPISSFINDDGRIRPHYNPTGPVTGRICVDPDTFVEAPRNLQKYPEGILLKNLKIGDWVYSFDEDRELCLQKIKWVGPTKVKPTLIIHTDKGFPLTISRDHLVRKWRGEWAHAKDLKVGDRLLCMPPRSMSDKLEKGGHMKFFPHSRNRQNGKKGGGIVYESRFIWTQIHNQKPHFGKAIIHHVDGNPLNNHPINLQWLKNHSSHISLHHKLRQNHKIVKIEVGPTKLLWDLEVENTHCFIGNDIALHNSASKPNVQQSGKDDGYRNIFVAEEGKKLLSADYAGQELRWLAIQSKDKNLLDAFNNDKDLHLATANKVFNLGTPDECLYRTHPEYESYKEKYKDERYKGKNSVNFPVIYGSTEYGISKSLKISEAKAKKIIDDYYELYPGVKVAISACVNHLYKKRYVKDFFGRRRRFQYIDDKVKRQAFNFLIQAPSASQLKVAANRVHKEIPEVKIIMLIHDEIVMEVDKDFNREGDVVKIMKEAVLADIPFEVETTEGLNFGGLS